MKYYSGRWVIISLVVICFAVGAVLYKTFKESGNYKGLIMAQMQKEFLDYTIQQNGREKILVATYNSREYFVDLKGAWKFELHDKLLVVKPPNLEPEKEKTAIADIEKLATAQISHLLEIWIMDKFHTLKDITYQIQF